MLNAARNARFSIDVLTGSWDYMLDPAVGRSAPPFPPADLLFAVQPGLRLRCLFITLKPSAWERVSQNLARVGWDVRHFHAAQTANFVVIDDEIAFVRPQNHDPANYHQVTDHDRIIPLIHYLNNVWTFAIETANNEILYDDIILPTYDAVIRAFETKVELVSSALIDYFAREPQHLRELPPRKFEELVADLLARDGYEVHLTPQSKDGGRDILATRNDQPVPQLLLVECKRYGPNNPVGVHLVRALYGVVQRERATAGLLASTSRFTRGALAFQQSVPYHLSLKDYESIVAWLRRVAWMRHH